MKPLPSELSPNPSAVGLLRKLGFSGYEASVWLELVNGFPATAYQVAKRGGLQRANVYRALERLTELQAVTIVHSKPTTYSPVDPKSLVTRLTAGLAGECEWFSANMTTRMQSHNRGAIQTASGAAASLAQLKAELLLAKHYAWLKGEAATLNLLASDIQSACARGVAVKIIAFGAWRTLQRKLPQSTVYPHEGNGLRLSTATDALLTLACDGRAVTTAVFSEEPTVTSVQDHALTYQLHSYLLHEIFLAELVLAPTIGPRITRELKALRKLHRPEKMEHSLSQPMNNRPQSPPDTVARQHGAKRRSIIKKATI